MPNWSDLPEDIALEILHYLHINVVDVIRFGGVCKPWHQLTLLTPPKPPPLQFPWLMLTSPDTTTDFSFRFLNLSNNILYSLPPPPYQPPPPPPSRSTTNGWFFMFQTNLDCSLINPITKQQIPLPQILRSFFLPTPRQKLIRSFPSPWKSLIRKAVFSSPPTQQNCIVLIISQCPYHPLLFCKLYQTQWIPILHQFNGFLIDQQYQDIIYFNNQFYAVDAHGRIFTFDLNANPPSCQQITAPFPIRAYNTYLVEVCGELVYVSRFKDIERFGVSVFFCYKQNKDTKEWSQVDDLGDHAIFLGFNQSGSLLASDYSVCQRNVIYSTDYDHDNPVGDVRWLPPVLVTTSM